MLSPTLEFGFRNNREGNADPDGCWISINRAVRGSLVSRTGREENSSHSFLGRVVIKMQNDTAPTPNCLATARKIIAAYEMYYALKECLFYLPAAAPARKLAEAAIDRAENEPLSRS